jgi:hypothetical protein
VAIKYDSDGKVTNYNELQYAPNTTPTYLQDWISRVYGTNSSYSMSRTYVKLREVVVTYNFPKKLFEGSFVSQASVSLVGRNLLYFAEKSDIDVEQYAGTNGQSGLQTPTMRRFGFNININF